MTSIEPQVSPMGRYSVKETCQALGICRETLRKYTESGHISVSHRKTNMRPYYLGKAIIKFWQLSYN